MLTRNYVHWPLLAAALLLAVASATCGGADSCVQVKCVSGAAMEIPLGSRPASGTLAKVCRNDECHAASLPELPDVQEASAGLSFPDATFVVGILWQSADQTVGLDLEWQVESADGVTDGDHYLVALVAPSGAESILLDKTATYATVAPTPEQCSPSPTCRIAQLSP